MEAGAAVLASRDIMENVLRRLSWMDAGALMLASRAALTAVQGLEIFPGNPSSTVLAIRRGMATMPLRKLHTIGLSIEPVLATRLLHVTYVSIGIESPANDALVASQVKHVRSLDLSCRKLSTEQARPLADAVGQLCWLTQLNLDHNRLGWRGVCVLAPALSKLTRLEHLLCGYNDIGLCGVLSLSCVLVALTRLTGFSLRQTPGLGSEGAAALAHGVRGLKMLRWIDLDNTDLGAQGVLAVKAALEGLSLTRVQMRGCCREPPWDVSRHPAL